MNRGKKLICEVREVYVKMVYSTTIFRQKDFCVSFERQ